MSSFWLSEIAPSCISSPGVTLSPGTAVPPPASLTTIAQRTIVSAPASQSQFSINLPSEESNISTSPLKVSRSRRSFFTSKFKLFKARRTTVSITSDAADESSTLNSMVERQALPVGQISQHQSNTASNTPQSSMIGLGLVGLEFNPTNGKYLFKDCSRTLSEGSSYTMERGGSDASRSTCPSPSTPSPIEASFHGKEQLHGKSSSFSMNKAIIGELLKCSIEEMDPADVAGILGVLCQDDSIVESQAWNAIVDNPAIEGTFPNVESPAAASTICISAVASPKYSLPRSHSISIILDHGSKTREQSGTDAVARGRSMTTSSAKKTIMAGSRIRGESHERIKAI